MKPTSSFGVVLLLLAAVLSIPAFAQTTAAGPYYATPSWDQKLQCDTQTTCPRFVVLSNWNNEAVLDRETGLVWERSPSTTPFTWNVAQIHCNQAIGNRWGWRLPTLQDLGSLIDPTVLQPGPTLAAGHPFLNVQSASYWSATAIADGPAFAWGVSFRFGVAITDDKTATDKLVWCVRGGQGTDAQ